MKHNFKGIYAPLTTPFERDEISTDKLKENIRKYNLTGLSGFVILGSSGESVYLSDLESLALVQIAKKTASSEKKIIAGTGKESTKLTLELTNKMADLGADAALIRTPSYFKSKMDQEALKKHFITVADQAKIPVLLYNNPRVTGISMDVSLIKELSSHPNIVGIKESAGDLTLLAEIVPHLGSHFHYLLGAAEVLLPGFMAGACGGILALADVAPSLCIKLYDLFLEKSWEEAQKLQLALIPLNKALVHVYGIPAIKYALDLLGYYGGPCRLPLLPLNQDGKNNIESLLKKLELF